MATERVYQVARRLGVSSKEVLTKLQELGAFVRSASSLVEQREVAQLEQALAAGQKGPLLLSPLEHQAGLLQIPARPPPMSPVDQTPEFVATHVPPEFQPDYDLEGRFVLLPEPSRRGGQSVVHKAKDKQTGEFVAVKIISAQTDALVQKFFDREMASLGRLQHPNIVRLIAHGTEAGSQRLFLVLEWVEETLAGLLDNGRVYKFDTYVREIGVPLLRALAYAHSKQVEHRDIKPGNILIRPDGTAVLADFGVAKLWDAANTELTVNAFRSGMYAPPELDGDRLYVRDVYSVGVVTLRCLQNEPIRTRYDIQTALDAAPVPPAMRDLLSACLANNPDERPANAILLYQEFIALGRSVRADNLAKTNIIWLALTKTARNRLEDHDESELRRSPEVVIQDDLKGDVWVQFRLDPQSGERDREKIEIIGEQYWYVAVHQPRESTLLVTGVYESEFEDLERRRDKSLLLGRTLTWIATRPSDVAMAQAGAAMLLERLDAFYENKEQAALEKNEAGTDELFDQWSRLMDAREEVERGGREPFLFRLDKWGGREGNFDIGDIVDRDLVGTRLEIQEADGFRRGNADVVDQRGSVLVLRSDRPLRKVPREGRLEPSLGPSEFSFDRQRTAIDAVRQGHASRADLGQILLHPEDCRAPESIPVDHWYDENLDVSKQRAVSAALGSPDFLLVQGPPGTGKTSFITEVVRQELARNPLTRILIVSQTHVAVDNALERLDAQGVQQLVRLGRREGSVAASTQHLLVDRQISKWVDGMRERASVYLSQRAESQGVKARYLRAALGLEELAALLLQTERIDTELQRTDSGTETDLATALGLVDDAADLQDRLDHNAVRHKELLDEIQELLEGDLTINVNSSSADARAAVALLVGEGEAAQQLLNLMEIQADWLQRVSNQDEMAAAFMETRRVVAGTNLGFLGYRAARNLDFDLCIVDEASKATATETLVPLSKSRRWILVGDTRQLPPMDEEVLRSPEVKENYDLSDEVIKETLFQRLSDRLPAACNLSLKEQYRMIRPIGDMISTVFYEGELRSPVTEGIPGYEALGKAVLWLDTSGLGKRRLEEDGRGGETSHANRTEATVCMQRLTSLDRAIDAGIIEWTHDQPIDVLLIAPYRRQVEELRRQVGMTDLRNLQAVAMSVDSVQGRQSDLALFSVTRSNTNGVLGFLGMAYWRRINVALSRARFGLTIVGDASFAQSSPGGLRNIANYMKRHPNDCEIREVDLL